MNWSEQYLDKETQIRDAHIVRLQSHSGANLLEKHRDLLDGALEAISQRKYWNAFSESPSPAAYGETAQVDGIAAVQSLFSKNFPLQQPGERTRVATENSPYGQNINISYPDCEPAALIQAGLTAQTAWQEIGVAGRIGILLEGLTRLNKRSHEIAYAVMLTTGQNALMAFQAGGPHAQERALETLAYAWKAMNEIPTDGIIWEKPGKHAQKLQKHYAIVGRGVALVIGCSTFPTWNTYPGLFAALATGNPVIVKPHPNAVLSIALSINILREVIAEQGLDPNILTLAISHDHQLAQHIATNPAVTSIDYTGSTSFGKWLAKHAPQARIYAEMAGVNGIVIESTQQYQNLLRNLAFTLSLYSGQMCTTPQNIYCSRAGIQTDQGHRSFEQFGQDLANAIQQLLADTKTACAILGAINSQDTLQRIRQAQQTGRVILDSQSLNHPEFAHAVVRTPILIAVDESDADIYEQECFGPITYLVATASTDRALQLAESVICRQGALTLGVYSTNEAFIQQAIQACQRAKVALSINLTQTTYVNQSAAFSDFHGTGANPAANSSYTNLAFVADRFAIVQYRMHTD